MARTVAQDLTADPKWMARCRPAVQAALISLRRASVEPDLTVTELMRRFHSGQITPDALRRELDAYIEPRI